MGEKNLFTGNERRNVEKRTIYPAVVRDINDPKGLNRVKAVIKELREDSIDIDDIPWSLPMSPRQIHVPIVEGDAVNIIFADPDKPFLERYYTTKMVADFNNLNNPSFDEALRGTPNSRGVAPRRPSPTYPSNKYVDLWLVGNQNGDVKFNEGFVEIIGGYRDEDDNSKVNETNPSKLFVRSLGDTSQVGMLGDNILLLTNKSKKKPPIDLDSESLDELFAELSPMVKGDVLIKILSLYRDAIISHSHKYHNQKANPEGDVIERLKQVKLSDSLSQTHKIN